MGNHILQILIAVDQLANALAGGMADETLSARAHRQRLNGRPWAAKAINALFFWQVDHCRVAYESELSRMDMPKPYRTQRP